MEDISAYKNLRKELMANRVYAHLSENLSSFLADTLLPTTDLVLPSAEKKKNVKFFFNPELCDITEDLVLSEPYMSVPYNERNRNIITAGNEEFVDHFLYNDAALHAEVAKLRDSFMNNAQARSALRLRLRKRKRHQGNRPRVCLLRPDGLRHRQRYRQFLLLSGK